MLNASVPIVFGWRSAERYACTGTLRGEEQVRWWRWNIPSWMGMGKSCPGIAVLQHHLTRIYRPSHSISRRSGIEDIETDWCARNLSHHGRIIQLSASVNPLNPASILGIFKTLGPCLRSSYAHSMPSHCLTSSTSFASSSWSYPCNVVWVITSPWT